MPSDSQRPPQRRPAPPPPPRKPAWTDREKAWLKFGGTLIVMGIVGVIAPVLGLKFRKVKDANIQIPVSIGLMIFGAVIDLIVFLRHGGLSSLDLSAKAKRQLMYGLGGAALLMILSCGGILIYAKVRDSNRFAGQPPVQPPPAAAPGAPVPPGNVGRPPAGLQGPPVHIVLKNIKNLDLAPLRAKLEALSSRPDFPVGMPPFFGGEQISVTLHYAGSLESLVEKISFGKAEITNPQARNITVIVDRTQFTERAKGKR